MNQRKRLIFNSISGLVHQFITMICGFFLPRMLLSFFGSEVNGLVSSISQFLGLISLADCGMGMVVQAALYKPLAQKDDDQISRILVSSERFFKKICMLLCAYILLIVFLYPRIVVNSFDTWYTVSLILAISISFFAQYYFGISYRMLLQADQRGYIFVSIQVLVLVANTVMSVIMMYYGASIQMIKLATSLMMMLQYLLVAGYCRRKYRINMRIAVHNEPIAQKWNGLAQHIAYVVLQNTDTIVLTLFSTLSNISVYHIYNLVVSGIQQLISASTTGVRSVLGNLYVKGEKEKLNAFFNRYEWVLHLIVTWAFACTWKLLVPFVSVYTLGITDADYAQPVFGALITAAQAAYCYRLPYVSMVLAAGHFKQTQRSSVVEAIINIVASILLVWQLGLVGVAIGTLAAMVYRTVYLVGYLKRNILKRSIWLFVKNLMVDGLTVLLVWLITRGITISSLSYAVWLVMAVQIALVAMGVAVVVNLCFYRHHMLGIIRVTVRLVRQRK